MQKSSVPILRSALLVAIVVLGGLIAYTYLRKGTLDYSPLMGLLGCLFIYIVTGRKRSGEKGAA